MIQDFIGQCSNHQEWEQRPWLAENETEAEDVLDTFPCFNRVSAQRLLSVMSIRELFNLSKSQILARAPWIGDARVVRKVAKSIRCQRLTDPYRHFSIAFCWPTSLRRKVVCNL